MKRSLSFAFAVAFCFASSAYADKSTKIIRGGLGFLYPDHNSFSNPGQFPLSYGMAVEAGYGRTNGSSSQTLTPSFVYGNGKVGVGGFYSRGGTDLLGSSASSSVGFGLGVSFLKDKLTLGAKYDTSLESTRTNDGNLAVTVNLNGPQRKGPSLGLGVGTTISADGGDRQNATASLGYSFRSNNSIEAGLTFNDIRDTADFSPFFAGTFGSQYLYLGGSYTYAKAAEDHMVAARLGVILGRYLDLSAQASYVLETGGAATYGATVRASF
jgi:hypothetical protein